MQLGAVSELPAVTQVGDGLRALTVRQTYPRPCLQKGSRNGCPLHQGRAKDRVFDDSFCLVEFSALEQRQTQEGSVEGNTEGKAVFGGQLQRGAGVGFSLGQVAATQRNHCPPTAGGLEADY